MYNAKILADSISGDEIRLTSFEVTFPRFILAEFNTHRMLSRNSASSRAIPLAKQIQKIKDDPFIPEEFVTEQKGMNGGDPLEEDKWAVMAWNQAMDSAVCHAERLSDQKVHKSLCNRIIEPYMWHTAIVTATEWKNFYALRTDENAQPEFRKIATLMLELHETSTPRLVRYGARHLPLVDKWELLSSGQCPNDLTGGTKIDWDCWTKVSAGRCARVSYLTHDGKRAPLTDVALHDRLVGDGHMSPTEHQAWPQLGTPTWSGNFYGWTQYRKTLPNENDFSEIAKEEAA